VSAWSGEGDEPRPGISVVIPVFNEDENLDELQGRLTTVLDATGLTYEIVYVDDGSKDRSVAMIKAFHERDCRVRLIRLSRNFGHQAALNAGLDHARGDAVVLMDADLQDPPELLTTFVERWRAGAEVVYGVREHREGSLLKRCGYHVFYRVYRSLADIDVPLDAGDFCLLDRQVADAIRDLPERQRFLRGLRSWVGFEQEGVPFDRPERFAGEAKYTLSGLVKLALDGLLSFSVIPLRLSSMLGFGLALAGVVYVAFAVIARIMSGSIPAGWTSIVAIVLVLGGVQLIMIGIVGEYLARVYSESKERPAYIIRDRAA
jgi:glycosyltransferase involved in cell wall biosynthesis